MGSFPLVTFGTESLPVRQRRLTASGERVLVIRVERSAEQRSTLPALVAANYTQRVPLAGVE